MLIFSEEIKHDAQKYKKSGHVFPSKAQKKPQPSGCGLTLTEWDYSCFTSSSIKAFIFCCNSSVCALM